MIFVYWKFDFDANITNKLLDDGERRANKKTVAKPYYVGNT